MMIRIRKDGDKYKSNERDNDKTIKSNYRMKICML